jgi:hypothetical protein
MIVDQLSRPSILDLKFGPDIYGMCYDVDDICDVVHIVDSLILKKLRIVFERNNFVLILELIHGVIAKLQNKIYGKLNITNYRLGD